MFHFYLLVLSPLWSTTVNTGSEQLCTENRQIFYKYIQKMTFYGVFLKYTNTRAFFGGQGIAFFKKRPQKVTDKKNYSIVCSHLKAFRNCTQMLFVSGALQQSNALLLLLLLLRRKESRGLNGFKIHIVEDLSPSYAERLNKLTAADAWIATGGRFL